MKDETMWLLLGGAVFAIFLLNKSAQSAGLSRVRPVFRPYTPRLGAIVNHPAGLLVPSRKAAPLQGQGFGMDHRSRYGYEQ